MPPSHVPGGIFSFSKVQQLLETKTEKQSYFETKTAREFTSVSANTRSTTKK